MKILHTAEYYFPSIGGVQEAVRQISENLALKGHKVIVATSKLSNRKIKKYHGVDIVEFNISGNYQKGLCGEIAKYQKFVLNGNFDVITNFAAQQWATDAILPILSNIRAKKVFVPTGFSKLLAPSYKEYFEKMKIWLKQYDLNIFLSNNYQDINFARSNGVKNIFVIPNGASKQEFLKDNRIDIRKQLGISEDRFLILSVGSHTNFKGHKEAMEIFSRAGIANSTLVIVGEKEDHGCYFNCQIRRLIYRLKQEEIKVLSLTREETVEIFKEANLFLFPSKIECSPIVLFESCAAKTPFLVTNVGNAEEIIKWTGGGEILPPSINRSARILKDLYRDEVRRKKLAKNGYKNWLKSFTWEKIAARYEHEYQKLLDNKRKVLLDIVSIAFNNDEIIHQQIIQIKRHLTDNYQLIIADNSTMPKISLKIQKICQENNVSYIKVASVVSQADGSTSHGLAMNWVYQNYLANRSSKYFGFIDHDIFPFKKTSLVKYFKNSKMFGHVQERTNRWYFWAGFCFYNKQFLNNKIINFLPVEGLDTGGGNWISVYSKFNKNKFLTFKHEYRSADNIKVILPYNYNDKPAIDKLLSENMLVETIGDWIHIFNGSNWRKVDNGNRNLTRILNNIQ